MCNVPVRVAMAIGRRLMHLLLVTSIGGLLFLRVWATLIRYICP